jgi:hypothetical protein
MFTLWTSKAMFIDFKIHYAAIPFWAFLLFDTKFNMTSGELDVVVDVVTNKTLVGSDQSSDL